MTRAAARLCRLPKQELFASLQRQMIKQKKDETKTIFTTPVGCNAGRM